jgi:hypothetical protein
MCCSQSFYVLSCWFLSSFLAGGSCRVSILDSGSIGVRCYHAILPQQTLLIGHRARRRARCNSHAPNLLWPDSRLISYFVCPVLWWLFLAIIVLRLTPNSIDNVRTRWPVSPATDYPSQCYHRAERIMESGSLYVSLEKPSCSTSSSVLATTVDHSFAYCMLRCRRSTVIANCVYASWTSARPQYSMWLSKEIGNASDRIS